MADTRKQTLRTQLKPSLHNEIMQDLNDTLDGCTWEFQAVYLKESVLSKYVDPKAAAAADARELAAIEKWLATELRNRKTNLRLAPYGVESNFGFALSDYLLELARREIAKVIGHEPPPDLLGSFSGGASTRHKRETGVVALKFAGQADVTPEGWPWIIPYIMGSTGWHSNRPEVLEPRHVAGNVMFTVPKSADINRVCCKEPDLNMFAQKACGQFIERRLKSFGIDLRDQSKNRSLALEGSKTGALATIDLSSASDSVTKSLVSRLLPPGWFLLLDAIRSKRTLIARLDLWYETEMFSSMGNGFTFPLETLIFWALARAVAQTTDSDKRRISVYGDDIIVPSKMAAPLLKFFSFCGFKVNKTKSFWNEDYRFRESCGGHYMDGADVTPFYVQEPIDNVERLIHFLNRLRKWSAQNFNGVCDPRFLDLWVKYSAFVDKRLYGGRNVADPTRLVTRHAPRFRLARRPIEKKNLERLLQTGLYLQSLNSMGRRSDATPWEDAEADDSSDASVGGSVLSAVEWSTRARLLDPKQLTLSEPDTSEWVIRKVDPKKDWSWYQPPYWILPDGSIL